MAKLSILRTVFYSLGEAGNIGFIDRRTSLGEVGGCAGALYRPNVGEGWRCTGPFRRPRTRSLRGVRGPFMTVGCTGGFPEEGEKVEDQLPNSPTETEGESIFSERSVR